MNKAIASKHFRFQPEGRNRTFDLELDSSTDGYSLRVFERRPGGERVAVALDREVRYSIPPATFYAMRRHYRGFLIGEVVGELRRGAVRAVASGPDGRDALSTVKANLDGWPEGYPEVTVDDLGDWTSESVY